MKKYAVIALSAFYLLIITGVFVCTLHCASGLFSSLLQIETKHCGNSMSMKGSKSPDCEKQHGEYLVKENLKPSVDLHAPDNFPISYILAYFENSFQYRDITLVSLSINKPPPLPAGKDICVKIRSLLI